MGWMVREERTRGIECMNNSAGLKWKEINRATGGIRCEWCAEKGERAAERGS